MPHSETTTYTIEDFYPHSVTIERWLPGAQISILCKLEGHLRAAQGGDRDRESRLINRIGQLRRIVPWNQLNENHREVIKESIEFLRSVGRNVDMANENPALWISARGGGPRWIGGNNDEHHLQNS